VSEKWTFRYCLARELDAHPTCAGKLASNVKIDERWSDDPASVFTRVA